MNKPLITIITFGLISLTPLVAEGGIDFSGDIQTLWGVSTPWASEESWKDSDTAGRFLLGENAFSGTLDAYYDNSSALADGTISYDALTNSLDFSLNDLWLDYSSSFWGIRIGRQKAAWGKADGIDITNVLCPSDMSSFSAMTSDDSKLAIDAIRLSFSGNQFTADAYWIPFFTPSALPLEEDNPLRKYLVPSSVDLPVEQFGTTLTLPVNIGALSTPELALWKGEYALKLSGYFSACDFSLYGYYGWDDIPFLNYEITYGEAIPPYPSMPTAINVTGQYKRLTMFGADAAIPLGPTVVRLETAFFPQRHFQKSAETILRDSSTNADSSSAQRNELSALAGIDWMPSGWTLTAQYFCDTVFGDMENLSRENAYTHGATLSISKTFLNETLEASISGVVNFNDFDSLLSPSVNYSLSDQINISTGAYIFIPGPDADGEYGKYKDLSTIYIKAKYSF